MSQALQTQSDEVDRLCGVRTKTIRPALNAARATDYVQIELGLHMMGQFLHRQFWMDLCEDPLLAWVSLG